MTTVNQVVKTHRTCGTQLIERMYQRSSWWKLELKRQTKKYGATEDADMTMREIQPPEDEGLSRPVVVSMIVLEEG